MKAILVVVAFFGCAYAEAGYNYPSAPSGSYGLPSNGGSSGGFDSGSSNGGSSGGFVGNVGGQTYRHVYVHSAPDEPLDEQARVIRIPGKQDKHVNIIFVKTPSSSASQQTEVILPEQDEQKTIVYVLHRKFDASTDLKIRAPRPAAPAKPQVYFIKYNEGANNGNNGGSSSSSSSSGSNGGSRPVYGAPF